MDWLINTLFLPKETGLFFLVAGMNRGGFVRKRLLKKGLTLLVLPLFFTLTFLCNFSEAADGRVIVVDGVDFLATATGNVLGDAATGYLNNAIDPGQRQNITDKIGQIKTFYWTNDAWDNGYAIKSLTDMLKSEYAAAKLTSSPLVIISHSWGTVLAYTALEQNPDIVVDKLITMGSPLSVSPLPLGSVRGLVGAFTSLKLSLQGILNLSPLSRQKIGLFMVHR